MGQLWIRTRVKKRSSVGMGPVWIVTCLEWAQVWIRTSAEWAYAEQDM